jgi:phosphatidylglycerol---prolipoprotein diacylglyceryl transferase
VKCHPTQVHESLFHLCLAGALWVLTRHDLLRDRRLKLYLIAYAGYRFLTEFIRPEPEWWLGLTFYQWASLALALALAAQWWLERPSASLSAVQGFAPRRVPDRS